MLYALRRSLCGVSVISMLAPGLALAQGAPAAIGEGSQASDLNDTAIVVTARRRDESIQDVPAVVNAVTSETVAKLNFREFNEIQTIVPGLSLTNTQNGTGGAAQLRGVQFDINASGNNPTVEFYQNDAPITAGVVLQQLYDVGQIEVLRGPQGTLRGRASPSGSITVTTRKPDLYTAGGFANATGNDIGTINFSGGVGIPIVEGIAAVRVAGVINEDEGNRVRTINTRIDGRDPSTTTKSGRISLLVTPIEALRFEGVFQRLDRRSRQFDQVESFNQINSTATPSPVTIRADDRLSNQETPRDIRQTYDIYNGRAELALGGQRLIYQFQHYTQAINSTLGQDYANLFAGIDFGYLTVSRTKSTSHEFRVQNEERIGGFLDYVVGVFDNRNRVPTNLTIQTGIFLPPALGGRLASVVNTPVRRDGKSHEQSIFGNLTGHFGDAVELSGGLRYIDYQSTGSVTQPGVVIPDRPINDKKLIYSAAAKYNLTRDVLVYASTGSSYRPGIDAIGDFSVRQSLLERSFISLPAESSKSYEAGLKSTLLDGKMRFSVSAFHQTFKNFPYRTPGNSGQSGVYYINYASVGGVVTPQISQFNFVAAVPVEVNGAEAEVSYEVSNHLTVSLNGSYSLGKIKNGTVACNDLNGDGIPDNTIAAPTVAQLQARVGANNLSACQVSQRSSFQSPFSATAMAEYGLPITSGSNGYIRGLFTYNNRSQNDPTSTFDDIKAYGLFNLYAGIRDPEGTWEINLFAKNLLDTTRVLSRSTPLSTTYQVLQPPTFRTAAAVTVSSTYTAITTNQPREFGLNARFVFGSR